MYWIIKNNYDNFYNIFELTENQTEFENKISKSDAIICTDLINLIDMNIAEILFVLSERYNQKYIYTNINNILIAINPFKKIDFDEKVSPINIAKNCFKIKKNHTILVNGESGAGKTETAKIILNELCSYSNKTLSEKILATNIILESFGNALTLRNNNSSRFGKFIKCYYDSSDILCGASIDTYLLEKIRVTHKNFKERNYHVFYYFLDNNEIKKLDYVNYENNQYCPNLKDELLIGLQKIGLNDEIISSIVKTIKIIACFGNFEEYKEDIANYWNISINQLEQLFYNQKITVAGEIIYKKLNSNDIKNKIDSIARTLYQALFDFIVLKINNFLNPPKYSRSINILDIFGFEVFEKNYLEQFNINFTNERLQYLFNHFVFEKEKQLYLEENIYNEEEVSVFKNESNNIHIIDQINKIYKKLNSVSQYIKGNDKQLVEEINKFDETNIIVEKKKLINLLFTVKHYAGDVEYNCNSMIEKNKNLLSLDIIEFLNNFNFYNSKFKNNKKNLTSNFLSQLKKLINFIDDTELHFIRCIKPNDNSLPFKLNFQRLYEQLKYNGVEEAVRVSRLGYPIRFTYDEFKKYNKIDYEDLVLKGKTKIFIKKENYNLLEKRYTKYLNESATLISKNFRKYITRLLFLKKIKSIHIIQGFYKIIEAKKELFK